MKIKFLAIFIILVLIGCESDDTRQNNPNLLNVQFDIELNLSLPQYSVLNFAGNAVYVGGPGIGNDGVIVFNSGGGFVAWDASDPNLVPNDCSRLIIDGITASSTCQNPNIYNLASGLPLMDGLQYGLLNYRVSATQSSVRVFN